MNTEMMKTAVDQAINAHHQELIELSDYLADNPEISGQEYNSVKKINEILEKEGFQVISPYAGLETSFFAQKNSIGRKYKIAILVEYDALPKLGHACGHNVSGSISILAGLALQKIQDALNADIHIIGTPIEETDGAKCKMADEGIFDAYDMAMMIHLSYESIIDPKKVCLSSYQYEFMGKSAHSSASPWEGRNALNGAQLFMHATDMLRQHLKKDVQLHGIYTDGGAAPNIVPDHASIEMYIRANQKDTLLDAIKKVEDCAKGSAIATQTTYKITETANMYLDLSSPSKGLKALAEVYDELKVPYILSSPPSGSSDIGNVSYKCPTFHPTLSITDEFIPLHTIEFEKKTREPKAHEAIAIGAKIIARQAIKVLTEENLLKEMKEECGF